MLKYLRSSFIVALLLTPLFQGHSAEDNANFVPEPKITWVKNQNTSKNITNIEAEDVLVNKEMLSEKGESGKWSFFVEGGNKWSGDKTLRADKITEDRSPLAPESAILKFRIPLEKGEKYDITINGGRSYGVSLDGKDFTKAEFRSGVVARGYVAKEDFIEFYVANCYVHTQNPGFTYIDWFTVKKLSSSWTPPAPNPVFNGFAKTRVVEKFPRSVTAIPNKDGGIYVSWRLLKQDPKDIAFDVFRLREGKEEKMTPKPVFQTTDFFDKLGRVTDVYVIRPAGGANAEEGKASAEAWNLDEDGTPYQSIKLADPAATIQKIGVGDLNGDGVYDFVFKTPNSNIDPYEKFWKPSTTTYKLEAHLADGTYLWTRDLGWGIECGMWYSPFIVFDFNGDGKAEVAVKEAEDKRDKDGRVYEGAEFLVVLDGMTGKEIARAPWPSRDGFENYNLSCRNQLSLGYLDGKTPCILALRGTYGTMKAEAWQLKDGKLESCWKFTNHEGPYDEGNKELCWQVKNEYSPKYYGMGAHQSVVADIDGDGRDEIIMGSYILNGNGDGVWSIAKGHPDYMILTDIIWENPGMEIAYMYESAQSTGGVCVVDAKTGKFLWKNSEPSKHVHQGYASDFDPTLSGPEVFGIDHNTHIPIDGKFWRFTNVGKLLSNTKEESGSAYKGVYWDADLEKEILSRVITDFKGGKITTLKGTPQMVADLFGDWREEIITSQQGEARIYSTVIPAMDRRVTLMQEHPYRMKVAINSQAYYYDPNLPYTPTFESNNFSLIFRASPQGDTCQVTVSASMKAPFTGTVTLFPPAGVTLDQSTWPVNLKPGEITVKNIALSGKFNEGDLLKGEIKGTNPEITYIGQVPLFKSNK